VDYEIPFRYVSLAQFNLRDQKKSAELLACIVEQKAKVVIIDALADTMPGGDENAVKDIQPVFLKLKEIADRTGCAILVIHHTNRGGDYRGSSAMKGAVEMLLMVASKPDDPVLHFKTEKVRNTEPFSFAAAAVFGEDSFLLEPSDATSAANKMGVAQLHVLRYLASKGPSLLGKIAANPHGCTANSVRLAAPKLAHDDPGLVKRVDDGPITGPAIYDLTERGKDYVRRHLGVSVL